jgi:hypothetical protein
MAQVKKWDNTERARAPTMDLIATSPVSVNLIALPTRLRSARVPSATRLFDMSTQILVRSANLQSEIAGWRLIPAALKVDRNRWNDVSHFDTISEILTGMKR